MVLDFADNLTANQDINLLRSDQYRAFNLLRNQAIFVDNDGIGLNIAAMVNQGIDDDQIESAISAYLVSFGCHLSATQIQSEKGNISIFYNFGGSGAPTGR